MIPETFYEQARICMLNSQIRPNNVKNPALLEAFKTIPREIFLPESLKERAYLDSSLKIAPERWLYEPMVFAKLAELADIKVGERVLLVGTGSGYEAAVLSALEAAVTAIEEDEILFANSAKTLKKVAPLVKTLKRPLRDGAMVSPSWDVIFMNGGTEIWPEELLNSLNPQTGRLVTVVMKDDHWGTAVRISPWSVRDRDNQTSSALEESVTPSLVADWVKSYRAYCNKLLRKHEKKQQESGSSEEFFETENGFEVKSTFQATVPVLPVFKKLREFVF